MLNTTNLQYLLLLTAQQYDTGQIQPQNFALCLQEEKRYTPREQAKI